MSGNFGLPHKLGAFHSTKNSGVNFEMADLEPDLDDPQIWRIE